MKTNIQYDFTSLNDFFNKFETPDEMMMDLAEVVMNYALLHDPQQYGFFQTRHRYGVCPVSGNQKVKRTANSLNIAYQGGLWMGSPWIAIV